MANYQGMLNWMLNNLDDVIIQDLSNEIQVNCPFCMYRRNSPDIKHHMYVNKYNRLAHCFRCDWRGNWISLIMEFEGCSYTEALLKISSRPLLEDYQEAVNRLKSNYDIHEIASIDDPFPKGFISLDRDNNDSFLGKIAIAYLKRRGIPEDFIYSGIFGIVSGVMRVYILASDTYWQGRTLLNSDGVRKYQNPQKDIGDTLGLWDISGLNEYINSLGPDLYVCEGLFSALAMIRRGIPALALLGKYARKEQLERFRTIDKNIVIMLDSDAIEDAWKIAEDLNNIGVHDVRVAQLKEGDPETCEDYIVHEYGLRAYAKWRLS